MMNVNKNLHSKTVLTEFARDFEQEGSETVITKLVNKIYEACNTVNADIASTSSTTTTPQEPANSENADETQTVTQSDTSSSISIPSNVSEPSDNKQNETTKVYQVDASQGRTSLNVIKRISNLLTMKEKNLNDYKNTELQKLWMPDDKSRECYDCTQKFTTFRRKHHCRLCGCIFCSKCCNQIIPGKIINCTGELRVCTYCSKVVLSYIKSPDINADLKSDLQALEEDLSNKFVGSSNNSSTQGSPSELSPHHRKVSVGYQEERLVSSSNILSNADRKTILQQSNTLKTLYEDMLALPPLNKGVELVHFLISNQKSSNKQQATAVLNAMIEAGFIVPLLTYENAEMPNVDSFHVEFNENLIYKMMKIEEMQSDIDANSTTQEGTGESICDDSLIEDIIPPSMSSRDNELQNSILSTFGSKPLLEAYCEHEELLLNQLLRHENLDTSWSKILIPHCARIAHTIRPEFCRTVDSMDVRNFINIKKISGGNRNETAIIGGVVFSKNVAHKDMKTKIDNPKVLLLQCAIAYQRVEGKFVTIESLILQEKEYLRNVTSRILSLNPDVVLVHKNVAGIAQELLRQNGITLILDVKMTVFERLARCMQCDIVTSIDSNFIKPKLGVCKRFYTKIFADSGGANKTLMFFEIPYSQRSCSLLLRGSSEEELVRVKKVSSFLLFARYNWRLELSYLLDVFAQPPLPKSSIFDSIDQQSPCIDQVANITSTQSTSKESDLAIKGEKKEKLSGNIENVHDFSDPLRASSFEISSSEPVEFEVQDTFDNKFRSSLASTILSISPYVNFPLPYLETEVGKKCELRSYFQKELFFSKQWADKSDKCDKVETVIPAIVERPKNLNLNPPHPFLSMKITVPADHKDFQTALADYRRNGAIYPKVTKMKVIERKTESQKTNFARQKSSEGGSKDALDINNHQRLPVLFCSFYLNDSKELPSSFCAQPLLLEMHFYGTNDISLGLFLERYCFRSSYICGSCKLPMMNHVRRYAHASGVVQVRLDQDNRSDSSSNILIASKCTICNATTQKVPMSPDTWCLSFAKFLELKFHGHLYTRRETNVDEAGENSQQCSHSLHHEHIQYFFNNGVIVSFSYSPVDVWEVKLPLLNLLLKLPELIVDKKNYMEKMKTFSIRGYEVYAKIHEKLANLSTETESPLLANLKKVLSRDQMIFKHRVEVVYTLLASDEIYQSEINDAIYLVYKELADSIELWDPRLNDVAIQMKNVSKNESTQQQIVSGDDDETTPNQTSESTDLELDLDGGSLMTRQGDEVISEKKEKEKKTIKKLLSILTSNVLEDPLPTPFTPHEHFCLQTGQFPILVHDQDLSSIIAYTLMSYDYKKSLENGTTEIVNSNSSPSLKRKNTNEGASFETNENAGGVGKENNSKSKSSTNNHHVEIQFQDSSTQFTCKSYFAREFDELRTRCLVMPKKSEDSSPSITIDEIRKSFARSLSQSVKWEARGGKSGSKFSKTSDDRFILKEMSKQDVGEFEKFAPHYFEYVNMCIQKRMPTLLAKIFGVFKVVMKKKESPCEKSVLVIENLFCNLKITNKYDLKGSERNRLVLVDPTTISTSETVLLDENLIKSSWTKPLYILTHTRAILRSAICRDASFLEKNHVMDYSLLVGLDENNHLIVSGIIDYIRKFTIDKKIESFMKQVVDQSKLPTIVSPNVYKNRFIEAMDRYFLAVPDRWDGLVRQNN